MDDREKIKNTTQIVNESKHTTILGTTHRGHQLKTFTIYLMRGTTISLVSELVLLP
jgi:hypothetical protein